MVGRYRDNECDMGVYSISAQLCSISVHNECDSPCNDVNTGVYWWYGRASLRFDILNTTPVGINPLPVCILSLARPSMHTGRVSTLDS